MNTLARRRHDAVPQREEHELGRRLPRAGHGPLAGQDQAGHGLERDRRAPRLAAHLRWRSRATPEVDDKLLKGYKAVGRTYKIHLDGYNLVPYLTGKTEKSPRNSFIYINDDGEVTAHALRQLEDGVPGAARRREPCASGPSRSSLRVPEDVQPAHGPIRTRGHHLQHLLRLGASTVPISSCPRRPTWPTSWRPSRTTRSGRRPSSFNLDEVMEKMKEGSGSK